LVGADCYSACALPRSFVRWRLVSSLSMCCYGVPLGAVMLFSLFGIKYLVNALYKLEKLVEYVSVLVMTYEFSSIGRL
jgi:hypothetical protein